MSYTIDNHATVDPWLPQVLDTNIHGTIQTLSAFRNRYSYRDEEPVFLFDNQMEYGTVPVTEVIQALRAEHWLNIHPEAPAELAAQIKAQMLAAFYTDTDAWKGQIISQARQSMFQAVDGLSG